MIKVGEIEIGGDAPLAFILGPCVIESEKIALEAAAKLVEIMPVPFIYKSSFDKANRSSIHSYRGPGLKKGLEILQKVKTEFGIPVTTDIHLPEQADSVAEVCDLIQIPALLCRQTDLLLAAAKTGRPLHVKKGQFMAPHEMQNVLSKLQEGGGKEFLFTDRGSSFGYNNLVTDMRSIPIMKKLKVPVCFDASHSVQLPAGHGHVSGGQREFIPHLAKAAVAVGADAIFMETHPNPQEALCDKESQWPLNHLLPLVQTLLEIHALCKGRTIYAS
jgi:2-dehydro-3-deoxyphosphooctonate aldolase (KDO 8-P synthase)